MITFTHGDLFAGQHDYLVNPVNCMGVMGKGLAQQFASRYPELVPMYQMDCRGDLLQPGTPQLYGIQATPTHPPLYIICFPTKRHWRDRSNLADIEAGLSAMRKLLPHTNGHISVAVPPLGCGLGGLDWADVRPLIIRHLAYLTCRVVVYEP